MVDDADIKSVTFTITNPGVANGKSLYTLIDVDVQVAGLSFRIIGFQIRRDRKSLIEFCRRIAMSPASGGR